MDEKNTGRKKVAVLIDAENVSLKYLEKIFERARSEGVVCFKRIYGNVTVRKNAVNPLLEYGITHIQSYSYVPDKNTADMVLAVDAMVQLYKNNVDVFCIVSSDSDFAPLVNKIIEEGRTVIGMGESKAVKSFRNSCDEFVILDEPTASKKQPQKPKAAPPEVINETVANEEKQPLPETDQDVKSEAAAEADAEAETVTEAAAEQSDVSSSNSEVETAELPDLATVKEIAFEIIKSESPEDGRLLLTTLITELQERIAGFSVKKYKKGNATKFAEAIGLIVERSGKNSVFVKLPTPAETLESDKRETETVMTASEHTETAGEPTVTANEPYSPPSIEQVTKDIEAILLTNGDEDGWVRFKFVSDELNKRYVFSPSNYDCATMGELLEKMGFEITTKIKSKKKTYYVRLPREDIGGTTDTEGAETKSASDLTAPAYEETVDAADDVTLTVETEATTDTDQPEPDKVEQEEVPEEEEEETYVIPVVNELPEQIGTVEELKTAILFILNHESVSSPTRLNAAIKYWYPDFKLKDYGYTKMAKLLDDLEIYVF